MGAYRSSLFRITPRAFPKEDVVNVSNTNRIKSTSIPARFARNPKEVQLRQTGGIETEQRKYQIAPDQIK